SLGTWTAVITCILGAIVYVLVETRVNAYRRSLAVMKRPRASFSEALRSRSARSYLVLYAAFPFVVLSVVYATESPTVAQQLINDSLRVEAAPQDLRELPALWGQSADDLAV